MTALVLHDVSKITVKRQSALRSGGSGETHNWTCLVITHRASGYEQGVDDPEYRDITDETEVTLHHFGILKLPFKIESAS